MVRKPKMIAAGKFKAQCLALLDRVARTKQGIVVTKRGVPMARLVPLEEPASNQQTDVFARARTAAGGLVDPNGAADVSFAHDRYLADAWGHEL